jgi:UPF0271 protein
MTLLLNCDLGEIDDPALAVERAVMPLIDLANISCGHHAGERNTIVGALGLARDHGVRVGAHPGYPDRANFGRVSVPHTRDQLIALLRQQIAELQATAATLDVHLHYVKPHGALYNDMMANPDVRSAAMAAVASGDGPRRLMLLASAAAEEHRREGAALGIDILFEAFADRGYSDRGNLLPRGQPGAVLDHDRMLAQVAQLLDLGSVTTAGGKVIPLHADTLCVHGDTPGAVAAIKAIRALLQPRGAG